MGLSIPGQQVFERFEGFVPGQPAPKPPPGPRLVRKALRWIDEAPDQPFFLYLHLLPPHSPYTPPPRYRVFDSTEDAANPPLSPTSGVLAAIDLGRRQVTPEELAFIEARYDANLLFADALLASLLAGLEQRGWLDRSVVVVTSDHGEAFGQHGRFLHNSTLYDEMLQVPLVLRLPPGALPGGTRVGDTVSLVDLAPTLADLFDLGPAIAEQADGRSLLPRLAGAPDALPRAAYAQREDQAMIVVNGSKLIANVADPGRDELYDLEADPLERIDLAASNPQLVSQLRERVEPMLDERVAGLGLVAGLLEQLPEEATRQLEALGYLLEARESAEAGMRP